MSCCESPWSFPLSKVGLGPAIERDGGNRYFASSAVTNPFEGIVRNEGGTTEVYLSSFVTGGFCFFMALSDCTAGAKPYANRELMSLWR